jgi:hypothetical protein
LANTFLTLLKRLLANMNEKKANGDKFYSLFPLEDFKAVLGIDDREDKIARFCLVTAALSIEQYCKRKFLKRKNTDYHTFHGDNSFTLKEYPVRKILSVGR